MASALHPKGASRGPRGPRGGARVETRSDVKTQSERMDSMKKVLASVLSVVTMVSLSATAGMAQTSCPPEVASAKAMLTQTAKSQDVQAPRSLAGPRQDVQAPRSQDIQSPRGQDVQAPRGQDVQSPRSQDVQSPPSQDIHAPRTQDIQPPRRQETQTPATQATQSPRTQEPRTPDTPST